MCKQAQKMVNIWKMKQECNSQSTNMRTLLHSTVLAFAHNSFNIIYSEKFYRYCHHRFDAAAECIQYCWFIHRNIDSTNVYVFRDAYEFGVCFRFHVLQQVQCSRLSAFKHIPPLEHFDKLRACRNASNGFMAWSRLCHCLSLTESLLWCIFCLDHPHVDSHKQFRFQRNGRN